MRTTDRIGFKLIIKEPDTAERTIVVCPRYDGLKMKWQRESGKVYHTLDFEGNLEFWGVDFVTLLNCPLRTVFELVVFLKGRGEVGRSEFRKTDCEWNLNDGWCKVDISTYDKYSKINDHKDDEYNLVSLGIPKKRLDFYAYPSSELYVQGDNHLYAFQYESKVATEVDVANPTTDIQTLTTQFGPINLPITASAYIASGTYAGKYTGISDYANSSVSYQLNREDGAYGILIHGANIPSNPNGRSWEFVLVNLSSGTEIATTGYIDMDGSGSRYPSFTSRTQINFNSIGVSAQFRCWITWGRLVSQLNFNDSFLIENNIRGDVGKRYGHGKYCFIKLSSNESTEGTHQIEGSNMYYAPPDTTHDWTPVYWESWYRGISIWVCATENRVVSGTTYNNRPTQIEYNNYKTSTFVNDFYLFTDAVRAVIQKIDPAIVFEDSDSHFLFDNPNPLPSSAKPQGPLYISQKSNVLNLGYDYPAWQAPIKWSQIETFLKNALGCYWDLYEDSNGVTHLRIEHQFFYDNGGTYNPQGNPSATIDLLHNRFDVATRQPQAFHTNRWKWDVDGNGLYSSACRYEYGWMDTQSAIFDGDTVEVPEEYRLFTDDKTEERKVDWFSSDIDFLTAVQAECSSDGFVVVMESYTNPGWIVSGHENYSGQNYQLSFEYLQPLYLVYGIYAEKVKIGDGDTAYDTGSHARMRTSEVSFNLLEGEWVEPSDMLITEVGEGVIDTLTYDMSSEKWTATVRYNNE